MSQVWRESGGESGGLNRMLKFYLGPMQWQTKAQVAAKDSDGVRESPRFTQMSLCASKKFRSLLLEEVRDTITFVGDKVDLASACSVFDQSCFGQFLDSPSPLGL
jgi:hypothetical protein